MEAFIKKHEYNYIKKCLTDLNNAFTGCVDINIIEAAKANIQEKIFNTFTNLSEHQIGILDINKIKTPLHIDMYIIELDQYVYGMQNPTNAQLGRLFKKEKKLKMPSQDTQDQKNVYLGWIDDSTQKLYVAYNMGGQLIGMACRLSSYDSNVTRRCVLCNHIGRENDVAPVSPVCKTSNAGEGSYRSLGFNLCLDSSKCNDRIVSTKKLEEILKDVNNIK
jgi:hypothetical protein